jgi:hypothetical protein
MHKRWCHDHKNLDIRQVEMQVIWSDESSFMLFPTSGRVYVWRTLQEAYNLEYLVPTVEHGHGSVMVWAAISRESVGSIITLHR